MKSIRFVVIAFSQECPDSCDVFIPNNLTPDCEAFDCEILEIITTCKFKTFHFKIFDKWGEIIFESDDPNKKFDSRGNPQATYVWTLTGEFCNGEIIDSKGQITILL
jgi:hypothetical protein